MCLDEQSWWVKIGQTEIDCLIQFQLLSHSQMPPSSVALLRALS
jgi:hypothetical protein